MKRYEVDFQSMIAALRCHWKVIVASTVCFAMVGALCGGLYAKRGAATAQGSAQPLERMESYPDMSQEDAYSLFQNELELTYKNLSGYYAVLNTSEFLTEEEQIEIEEKQEQLNTLYEDQILVTRQSMNAYGAIYMPASFLPEQRALYETQLAKVKSDLISAKEAVETIRLMGAPVVESETITNTYASLLSQAANYGTLLQSEARLQFYLERLTTQQEAIVDECQELLVQQIEAAALLNAQITDLNAMADQYAAANHLNFLVSYDEAGSVTVTFNHTHGEATAQDNFLLVFLFCTLTGLCVGVYLSVCLGSGVCALPWSRKKQA